MVNEGKLDFFQEIAERNYTEAFEILGEDFIPPVQAAGAWGFKYTYMQLACLGTLVPARGILEWARDNNCMVIPGPFRVIDLVGIRNMDPSSFRGRTAWFEDKVEKFSHCDKARPNWLMLYKGELPDSTNTGWREQVSMLGPNEYVPNVVEAAWAFNTYTKVKGYHPFSSIKYVRTSSVYSGGGHVYVGYYAENDGLVVIGDSDETCRYYIGVASAKNL